MTELSPAAQAVWNAAWVNTPVQCGDIEGTRRAQVAAALRAAADQVVPEEDFDEADYDCLHTKWAAQGKQETREAFLAIATELESHQ